MLSGSRDILLFSTADWDNPFWTNKQHMACQFAKRDYRVLYVDSLGLRRPTLHRRDLRRMGRRLLHALAWPREVRPRLWRISPLALPFQASPLARKCNMVLLCSRLRLHLAHLGMQSPLIWGGTPEEAEQEARASHDRLAALFPGQEPAALAVSPFHTNPPYAVRALEQAGYTGFVSGIIHNDPEYLLGRAGIVPFSEKGIVSISQQSMLHGDCYRRQGGSIDVHVSAFEAQYHARGIFGYLDHPFSARYQYDWESKQQRLDAHQKLVRRIRSYPGVCFATQQECFDFVRSLSQVRPRVTPEGHIVSETAPTRDDIVCRYHGREHILSGAH